MNILNQAIEKITGDSLLNDNGISQEVNVLLLSILDEMMEHSEDIQASMVSSRDGIAWAQRLVLGFDQHRFAAMSGAMLALSDNLTKEASKGLINNVLIEGDEGHVFLLHAGSNLILTVFTKSKQNLGMSLAHAKIACQKILSLT